MPLAMLVATGDSGPEKVYRFPRDTLHDPRNIVMFEHVEGASYCEVSGGTRARAHVCVCVCMCLCVEGAPYCEVSGL